MDPVGANLYNKAKELHRQNWAAGCAQARRAFDSPEHATEFVQRLAGEIGWRERYSAAIIITAFRLENLIPVLLQTFHRFPESHTCRAFAYMVEDVMGIRGLPLLEEMKLSCGPGDRGKAMESYISDTIERVREGDTIKPRD